MQQQLTISELLGLGRIPTSKVGAHKWLDRNEVRFEMVTKQGGETKSFFVTDLPDEERRAYLSQAIEAMHLDPGEYDELAWDQYLSAPKSIREKADQKAEMVVVLRKLGHYVNWPDRLKEIQERTGIKSISIPTLKRYLRDTRGVDPINFAPALLPKYALSGAPKVELSEAAWAHFMRTVKDAAPTFPLVQAWRDVDDVAALNGWSWPSYATVNRRWKALPKAQRSAARYGRKETAKQLYQPIIRDKTSIRPMEWVSLDGRTQNYWADMGEGRAERITMIALIDVASNKVLGYELTPTENSAATARLIRRVCQQHGIFDRLYTDNGSAFAGHRVAGGTPHKFRNASTNKGARPLGICKILGIDIKFALPGNAQAKIAERTFATLSRVIDDRPEFRLAHTGHNPGASPTKDAVPVPFERLKAVVEREITRHNSLPNRRSQGAKGRSYDAVFQDGVADRIPKRLSARQIYLSSLVYYPVAVDRVGQVKVDGWVYGKPNTQQALLKFHETGTKIVLGRDPDDLAAPAIAFDEDYKLICEGILPVKPGVYGSVDGIREGTRNRKLAGQATKKAAEANQYATDAEFQATLDQLSKVYAQSDAPIAPASKVVAPHFNSPLKDSSEAYGKKSAITAQMFENFDRANAERQKRG